MAFHLPFIFMLCCLVNHVLAGTSLVHQLGNLSDRELIIQLINRVSHLENDNILQRNEMEKMKDTIERQNEAIVTMKEKLTHGSRMNGAKDTSRDQVYRKLLLNEKHEDASISKTKHEKNETSNGSVGEHNVPAKDRNLRDTTFHGIRQISNTSPVAFSAYAGSNIDHLGAHQNIVFEHVNVDTGNVYNPNHGVFTVPVAGVYLITSSVLTHQNREVWCEIVVNGIVKARIYARGTDNRHDQGSQTILLHLQQGDDVAVQNLAADDSVYGAEYTTFSGFLLFEEEKSAIVG